MNIVDIITKKRDGHTLSDAEINYVVSAVVDDSVPDYQLAAFCMAVYFTGMTPEETTVFTMAIAESGETLSFDGILPYVVDKHSSGGVGDKTTLVVLPLVAACGVPVAKMSGRGLSFTGGTLDKIESIPGFNVNLSQAQFMKQASEHGLVLAGQSADLAPADGKLYALRDVTGTVPSMPLIASSIMSKKLAAGADAIVLDVKTGAGAFMQTVDEARQLAELMVQIGQGVGRKVTAVISDMSQPLGKAVGNALEVIEAIETLRGGGPDSFREHCLEITGHMLRLAENYEKSDLLSIRHDIETKLQNGDALAKFRELIGLQGGDPTFVDDVSKFPQPEIIRHIEAPVSGTISAINAREVGLAAVDLGAGRRKKGDPIDHAVGIVVEHAIGDSVSKGDLLCTVYARNDSDAATAAERVIKAHSFTSNLGPPLFYDVLSTE